MLRSWEMAELAVDLDVHAVSETVARMVARRDLQRAAILVEIASEDSQARTAPRDLERGRDLRGGRHGLGWRGFGWRGFGWPGFGWRGLA